MARICALTLEKNHRLQNLGMGDLTGVDAVVALHSPQYVAAVLLHRHFVDPQQFEHKDRLKFTPQYDPPAESAVNIGFQARRGVLKGRAFVPTYRCLAEINPDIVHGVTKVTSRIEIARQKHRQAQ